MLPDIGGSELVIIAIVALIVVGPKDLPVLLRKLGQFTAKLRGMAAEFRSSFDEMARQSELEELRREVDAMRKGQFSAAEDAKSVVADMEQTFSEVGAELNRPAYEAPASVPSAPEFVDVAPEPAPKKPRARKAPAAKASTAKVSKAKAAVVEGAPVAPKSRKPRAKKIVE